MPLPTPFHEATSKHCVSLKYKDWSGYHAVCAYDTYPEREYFALRHAAGLIDVSPLFKYEVTGSGASHFLSRIMTKDITKLKVGQVTYCCWCDDQGHLLDDGTVARLSEEHFRVTSAEPAYAWMMQHSRGFEVHIEDSSEQFAALSVQGPNAREVLRQVTDIDMDGLKFFRVEQGQLASARCWVSRTGYTGDLGYEVWVPAADAVDVYDAILHAGRPFGAMPVGLDAMDITRIEAGFILNGIDYFPAKKCLIESRKSTPYEVGLGWTVQLNREPFIGQKPLQQEFQKGPKRKLVGLDVDWLETESLFAAHDLPPEVPAAAWRCGIPIYDAMGDFVGQATSGTWSPTLKKNLALATVSSEHAAVNTKLQIEMTVEYQRRTVTATVVETPFFNPERKRKP